MKQTTATMARLPSPDTVTLLASRPSPTGSEDNNNPAASLQARGAHSRVPSRSPSAGGDSRAGGPRRETRRSGGQAAAAAAVTSVPLPGPVPHGGCTRNVLYYQNRFIVIDSAPAGGKPAAAASSPPTATPTTGARRVTSAVTPRAGGGASGRSGGQRRAAAAVAAAGGERAGDDRSKRKATNVAAASAGRQMASGVSATACGGYGVGGRGFGGGSVSGGGGGGGGGGSADAATGPAAVPSSPSSSAAVAVAVAADHNRARVTPATQKARSGGTRGGTVDMDACSVAAMDGRGIEIIVSDETGVSHHRPDTPSQLSGKRALLKRVGTLLLDNRMQGKENCQHLLTEHPEEYRVLKRVLNIIFVAVGMALLVSVFVVIVYTAVGEFFCVFLWGFS